ncbi:MAG: hypothetical protein AB4050_01030, partial [Synechococcus sp.]
PENPEDSGFDVGDTDFSTQKTYSKKEEESEKKQGEWNSKGGAKGKSASPTSSASEIDPEKIQDSDPSRKGEFKHHTRPSKARVQTQFSESESSPGRTEDGIEDKAHRDSPPSEQGGSTGYPDFIPLDVTNPPELNSPIAILENGELVNGRKFLQLERDGRTVCYREPNGGISRRWAEAVYVLLSPSQNYRSSPQPQEAQSAEQVWGVA